MTVVAPLTNQSGSSVRVTIAAIAYRQQTEGVWSVDGSPADAVAIGLQQILRATPPDLVVSGANFGQNLGANVVISGTVGAATMALQSDIPAIAVSVGLHLDERDAQPQPFPSTLAAFDPAAEFVVALIRRLQETHTQAGALLPSGIMLNVNYPALAKSVIKGVKFAALGHTGGVSVVYRDRENSGSIKPELAVEQRVETVKDADTALFNAGWITIGMLDGNWDATVASRQAMAGRLSALLRVPAR